MHSTDVIRKHRSRFILGNIMLLFLLVSVVSAGQEETYFGQLWEGKVPSGLIAATLGDLSGNGVDELILATANTVYVYAWDEESEQFHEYVSYQNFPALVSSLTAAKVGSSYDKDVLFVGMAGSGAVQMYTLDSLNKSLRNEGTVGRLWNAVQNVFPIKNGNGEGAAIAAQGVNGQVVVWQYTDGRFQQTWSTPFEATPDDVVAVGASKYTTSSIIVLGQPEGTVSTYGWQWSEDDGGMQTHDSIVKLFENHPWGAVRSLDLVPRPGESEHMSLFVTTSRNILYEYEWDGDAMIHVNQWAYPLTPGRGEALSIPQQNEYMWFALENGTLSLWNIGEQNIRHVWDYPERVEWFSQARDGTMIAYGADNTLRLFGPVSQHHVRVSKDGRTYPLRVTPLVEDDIVYLAADDVANILALRSWRSREGQRLTGIAPWFQFFIVDANSDRVNINGKTKKLDHVALFHDNSLYIPMSFVELLGYDYQWIPQLRLLYIDS